MLGWRAGAGYGLCQDMGSVGRPLLAMCSMSTTPPPTGNTRADQSSPPQCGTQSWPCYSFKPRRLVSIVSAVWRQRMDPSWSLDTGDVYRLHPHQHSRQLILLYLLSSLLPEPLARTT